MTENLVVLSGSVASTEGDWKLVQDTVAAVFGGNPFILLAEDRDPMQPPRFDEREQLETSSLPRGRAFGADAELRWREVRTGVFSITFLAEADPVIPDGLAPVPGPWKVTGTVQKLTGAWSPKMGDWTETSVPGISGRYTDLADKNWTAIALAAFNFHRAGTNQMTRYCRIIKFERAAEEAF